MELAGVRVVRNTSVDRALVERERLDMVIVATGAEPYWPAFERRGELQVVDAWQVLRDEVQNRPFSDGRRLALRLDRPGTAERLVRAGHQEFRRIGDCLAPLTAEEAIYEGLKVAWEL